MCGIVGKINLDAGGKVELSDVKRMSDELEHRGPDDEGFFLSKDNCLGFGHRRLAIIDLSPLGHQPMEYLNRYVIVFNGEIYNYLELREDLSKIGYKFKSKSDTEVILALYDKYKEKCVDKLRGMFAFAIYDKKEQIVFCARDRVGKKPFKYYYDDKVFIFASELKAILTQKEYKKKIDYEAIYHYLTLQYVPAPMTGFLGIKKLKPGHYLVLDLKNKRLEEKIYWKLDYSHKMDFTVEEWKTKILSTLRESVNLRMIADVPLGAFLSGGIDSSAIVWLMSENSRGKIKTFNISFDDEKHDESRYAKIIADKFNTDHTVFKVKPDAVEVLPKLVKMYEEPYADSSALPSYYLAKQTRDHVTVALNGDGGDENFGGYDRYLIQKIGLMYENFKIFNKLANPLTNYLYNKSPSIFNERLQRFTKTFDLGYKKRYFAYTSFFTQEEKDLLWLGPKIDNTYDLMANKFDESGCSDKLDQTFYVDFCSYLPECLLAKVDIATMMASLEGRSPFLDHKMLELSATMKNSLKIKGGSLKYILKEALRGIIPDEVMDRPKQGFMIPIQKWFQGELGDLAYDLLIVKKSKVEEIIRKDGIRNLLSEHKLGKLNHGNKLWSLLTLELWLKEYF